MVYTYVPAAKSPDDVVLSAKANADELEDTQQLVVLYVPCGSSATATHI